MEPVISFENFGFQYTTQAEPTLHDIRLTIRKGEKVLIAGPSGCGKSTLVHCMNGLIPNSYPGEATGKLTIGGQDAQSLSLFDFSKVVGTVLQDSDGQFIGLTVAEDIAFALENDCMEQGEMKRLVENIAQVVDVSQVLGHAPCEISGGQKQRVALSLVNRGVAESEIRPRVEAGATASAIPYLWRGGISRTFSGNSGKFLWPSRPGAWR